MLYTTLVSFWSGDDWIPGGLSEPLFNAKATSGAPSVMKAQILAGGRGKGKYNSDGKGGVRIVDSWVPTKPVTSTSSDNIPDRTRLSKMHPI